jgi:cytochrome P450
VGEAGLTFKEMVAQVQILILAGSETSATALSGMTYYLLINRESLNKLTGEIRSAFASESDITLSAASKLPYLQAVLDESMRMYPPAPNSFLRLVPYHGEVICGRYVSGGSSVAMHHFASYRSSINFVDPDSFIPERLITDGTRDPRFEADNHDAFHPFSVGPRNCLGRK